MFKVSNDPKDVALNIFTPYSLVSAIDFEHVNKCQLSRSFNILRLLQMLFFLKLILNTKSFSKSNIYCNLKMVKLLVMLLTKNLYAKINNFKCLWIFRDNFSEPF